MSDGGKGSAPRKQQDQDAYTKNWDLIFGKPDKCKSCQKDCPDKQRDKQKPD